MGCSFRCTINFCVDPLMVLTSFGFLCCGPHPEGPSPAFGALHLGDPWVSSHGGSDDKRQGFPSPINHLNPLDPLNLVNPVNLVKLFKPFHHLKPFEPFHPLKPLKPFNPHPQTPVNTLNPSAPKPQTI